MRRNRRVFLPLPNLPSASRTAQSRSPRRPRESTATDWSRSPDSDFTGNRSIRVIAPIELMP